MPALPLDEAGKYVAAAYVVFFSLIVVYLAIMAAKVSRINTELARIIESLEEERSGGGRPAAEPGERDGERVA